MLHVCLCVDACGVVFLHRDAKCGKIQCQGGANRPVIGTNAVSIETNIPLQEGGRILCRGTHVYLGDDMPDPGLVLAGTKCGEGMVRVLCRALQLLSSRARERLPSTLVEMLMPTLVFGPIPNQSLTFISGIS